jgi:hypothetical protein
VIQVADGDINPIHIKGEHVREGGQQKGWRDCDEEKSAYVTDDVTEFLVNNGEQPTGGHGFAGGG